MDNVKVLIKIYKEDYSPVEKELEKQTKKNGCTWGKYCVFGWYILTGERQNVMNVTRTLRDKDILKWTNYSFIK